MDLIGIFIYSIGAVICHQLPERSFFWEGHQLPVCARCTGLYLSAALGVVGWVAIKVARGAAAPAWRRDVAVRLLLVAAVPTALSVASGMLGLWDGSNVTRAVLAVPLGVSAGAIVAAVATKDLR